MKPMIRTVGMVMATALVCCLFLFGCGQSSMEDAAAPSLDGGFWVPVTVDPELEGGMVIGDGSGAALIDIDDGRSHPARVKNVKPCSGTPIATTCTIDITNLDPDYYMANVFIRTSWCEDCVGDKFFSNGDIPVSAEPPMPGCTAAASTGFCGHLVDINMAGFCVVEDGVYDVYPEPYNYYGCPIVNTKGDPKPLQFIHPDCGSRPFRWDFSTATGSAFSFYFYVQAEFFPEVPFGPDGIQGTADDDSRFDFQDRSTHYLTLNSLEDDLIPGAINKAWWRLGSYKRSSALTGYGSGGADFTPAPGRYFALNVLAEYPDRIESYPGVGYTDASGFFSDYEYYTNWAWIVRYDPTVIKAVAANGFIKKAGTIVYAGGLDLCNRSLNPAHCDRRKPTYTGLESITYSTLIGGGAETSGYLFSYSPIIVGQFIWNGQGSVYSTSNGGTIKGGYAGIWPVHAGQVGLAKVNMVPRSTFFYPNTNWYASTAMIPSGTPDPEPEIGLGMYYFKVQPGTSGMGTQLYADHWVTENGAMINWTNGTAAGGFNGAPSDDWIQPCIPIQPGYEGNWGCNDALPIQDYWVRHGQEVSNPYIRHSGVVVPGGGAYQYWNVHLCVQ